MYGCRLEKDIKSENNNATTLESQSVKDGKKYLSYEVTNCHALDRTENTIPERDQVEDIVQMLSPSSPERTAQPDNNLLNVITI